MAAVFLCAPVYRKPTAIRVQQFESVKKKSGKNRRGSLWWTVTLHKGKVAILECLSNRLNRVL